MRGLEALCQASQQGASALAQCPLEAILDYDEDALVALRELLEREINLQVCACYAGVADGPPFVCNWHFQQACNKL